MRLATHRLALVVAAVTLIACGTKGSGSSDKPAPPPAGPEAPRSEVLAAHLDLAPTQHGPGLTGGSYHAQASVYVEAIETQFLLPLRQHETLLRAARAATPRLKEAGTYVWSAPTTVADRAYVVNLTGSLAAGSPAGVGAWSLRATLAGDVAARGIERLRGATSAAGVGNWDVFDDAGRPQVSLTYEYKSEDDRLVVFTVGGAPESGVRFGSGTRIEHRVLGDTVTLVYHDGAETTARTISWSRATKAGSYVDLAGERHCWRAEAASFENVDCPAAK